MRKLTYEEVKCFIEKEGFELLSKEYFNSKEKLEIKCNCGEVFNMSYNTFKRGHRCPSCALKNRTKMRRHSYDYVKKYIEGEGYTLISCEYKNNNSKLNMVCNMGHDISMTFGNFQRGNRCRVCANEKNATNQRHNYNYIKTFIESIGYTLIDSEYVRNSEKLNLYCGNGHSIAMSFKNLLKGNRCAKCNTVSHGENKIEKILKEKEVDFITQYKIKECKFKRSLPFDFYLPKYNVLIEYDGIQHYEIKRHFGGFEGFVDTKIRDTIKNIYCKNNDIKLIRIPYWEFDNIEELLNRELKLIR